MMQYGDSGTAYDQMDEFTFDEIARALVYEKTGYVLPHLGSLDPEWPLYRDWLGILEQAAYSENGDALVISIYEDDPKQIWYVQRGDLIKWCESRNLRPRFLFPLAKVGAGGTVEDVTPYRLIKPTGGKPAARKDIEAAFPIIEGWGDRLKKAPSGSYAWLDGTWIRKGTRRPGDATTYNPAAVAAALVSTRRMTFAACDLALKNNFPTWVQEWESKATYLKN